MMSIRKPRITRKHVIIIAGAIAGVLVLGGLGWWLLSQKVSADYKTARANYNQSATRAINDVSNNFFKDANDYDKRIKALQQLAQTTNTWKDNSPTAPNVLGVSLLSKEEKDSQDALIKQLEALHAAATEAQNVLEYEHDVVAALVDVSGKTGKNAEEQKALAAAWLAMLNKLKAIDPPAAAKTVHTDMLGRISNVQATLAALPDLFTKKDYNGFSAKQGELDKHIDSVRSLGDSYKALANAQDTNLARAFDGALKILR